MTVRARFSVVRRLCAGLGVGVLVAGCSHRDHVPSVAGLPLATGAQVVVSARSCDIGANAYCAEELVVDDSHFGSSQSFLQAEASRLHASGWTSADADNGLESADDSPGHRLRVTFATAYGDLQGIDQGWIRRSHAVALSLSRALFTHTSTLSILLEFGAS